jgi:hypothetical protein
MAANRIVSRNDELSPRTTRLIVGLLCVAVQVGVEGLPPPARQVQFLGSANATEPSQRRSRNVPIRCTLRNDGQIRCALTQVIPKSSHLAFERVNAFSDAAMVRGS